jgi:transketolase
MAKEEKIEEIKKLAKLIRYYILISTTEAGSGHPTSSLSATDLMAALLFGGTFRFDADHPKHPNNDRLIFSKGHASPLLYALWAAAGKLTERDMLTYRKFGSPLEGHPAMLFPYTEAATGSLGQGLSIGVGMALNAKYLDQLPYRTYVLLGDSEMSEGSQWESIQIAAHYRLDNLIGIIDVNRLGQRGETMCGWDLNAYEKRVSAFGWKTMVLDGHSIPEILETYDEATHLSGKPLMLIAKTVKGKGVSFIENQDGWHGKALKKEDCDRALKELGDVDKGMRGKITKPEDLKPHRLTPKEETEGIDYPKEKAVPTRNAYGNALKRIYPRFPDLVSLDGEVSNSTMAVRFQEAHPDRFFEMYIAEQNMVGASLGFSRRGKLPFVSTFAAFMTRAFDQIRMCQYSESNIKFVGSHAGVSIGQDGPSQMGLEDIAMFRTLLNATVLYPCDAVSTEKLVEEAAKHVGIVYIRTTREATPILYDSHEEFPIGGSKVLKQDPKDVATVVTAGITVFETLEAHEVLKGEGIFIRVIDLYSIKPTDEKTLRQVAQQTRFVLTVEDHYPEGGLGDAVRTALADTPVPVYSLAVRKKPRSGKPEELLDFEAISKRAIVEKIRNLVRSAR